jgi:hypothetical protein
MGCFRHFQLFSINLQVNFHAERPYGKPGLFTKRNGAAGKPLPRLNKQYQ